MVNNEAPNRSNRSGALVEKLIDELLDNGESFESIANIFNSTYRLAKIKYDEWVLRQARINEITKAIRYYVTASYGADIYDDEYFEEVAIHFANLIDKDVAELRDLKAQGYEKVAAADALRCSTPADDSDPQSVIDAFVKKL